MDILVGCWMTTSTAFGLYQTYAKLTSLIDIGVVLCGVYVADFFSACVHIFMDPKKITNTNNMIDAIAETFQEHHIQPRLFIQNKPFYNPGGQLNLLMFLSTPLYTATYLLDLYFGAAHKQLFIVLYTNIMMASFAQITHGFSHKRTHELPKIVHLLQKNNVLISVKEHHIHYLMGRNYATLTGWSNPLLNKLYKPILKCFPSFFVLENISKK